MAATSEHLELNCSFSYKQLKAPSQAFLLSDIFYSSDHTTAWRIRIDNSHPTQVGVYVTLVDGAPCTLQSYTLSLVTNTSPALMMFANRCTQRRLFPCNDHSWGFEKFCTRRELNGERRLVRDRKTKLIHVRCTMSIELSSVGEKSDDHRFATELFPTRSLEQWIELLKQRDDLPELTNRVNAEIETRLS